MDFENFNEKFNKWAMRVVGTAIWLLVIGGLLLSTLLF
jgi:hypothetical protein